MRVHGGTCGVFGPQVHADRVGDGHVFVSVHFGCVLRVCGPRLQCQTRHDIRHAGRHLRGVLYLWMGRGRHDRLFGDHALRREF